MTAIFGTAGLSNISELELMSKKLIHRGKQFSYKVINKQVILGINTSDISRQLYTADSKYIIGDISIYNKNEVVKILESRNISLDSFSNEELLLKMFAVDGINGLEKINGDFSFALWDDEKKLLFLGRDFLGCRPLYYIQSVNSFSFATEYKAFLNSTNSLSPDCDMIQHLQHGKRLPLDKTLLKDVSSVLPGSILTYDLLKNEIGTIKMKPLELNVVPQNEKKIRQNILDEFTNAIIRRVNVLGFPIGIALSGGIDSIALTYLCRKVYPKAEIYTFTAGYGENDAEILTARIVAKNLYTNHFEVATPPSLMKDRLSSLVWHMEDPFSRSEALQLFEIGRIAKKYVGYLMSAQGADGLFGGMPKYKLLYYTKKFPFFKNLFIDIYNLTQLGIKPKSIPGKFAYNFYFQEKFPDVPEIKGVDYLPAPIEFPATGEELLNRMLVKNYQAGVSQDIRKFEKNFAAWGIKYTSPFYDPSFINNSFNISDKYKIVNGREKYIFRKALKEIIPKNLINVPKLPQRMKYDHEFATIIDEISDKYLSAKKVGERGFFYYKDIQDLRRKNLKKSYSPERAMRLWTIILTEIWAQQFIDKEMEVA